jgi:preprotein translocase subunit YajC
VNTLVTFLPLIGIALLFWYLFVRPAQRRQREMGSMQRALAEGDEVMLTSGIFGTVVGLEDDRISLEVADGVTLKVTRAAIGQVTPPTQSLDEELDEEAELTGHPVDEPEEK